MPFVTTWTSAIVDYGTRLNLQAQDSSLQILNKHGAQKNWLFICMTRHGVCTLLSLTLWKKERFHY